MNLDQNKLTDKRVYLLLFGLVFVLYFNAINNEYALDDNIVVDGNAKVEEGISAIPELLKSRYAVDSKQQYEYRPIVSISFAIEKQFFSNLPPYQSQKEKDRKDKLTQANVSHFFNVLIYAITCMLLFKLLRMVFKEYGLLLPLFTVLLFAVHPLHTETVSNIKSRDELFMLLFMISALIAFLKYGETSKLKYLAIAPLFVILSFLSKKNGYTIAGVLPVIFYFRKIPWQKIVISFSTLIGMWVCVVLIRKGLVTQEVIRDLKFFENPLFFEGGPLQKLTVGLYCSLFYLKMLVYPYHMSFYYGYNEIPMATFKDWEVWVSLLVYIPLTAYGVWAFIKRKVIGLGILLWLGLMLPFTNAVIPIVGIVADRFTYSFSLGFCIVLAVVLFKLLKVDWESNAIKTKLSSSFLGVMGLLLLVYSGRTIARNPDWHDYLTLYQNDIEHLENSAKAHALISNTLYPIVQNDLRSNPSRKNLKQDVEKVIYHYSEALRIDPTYVTCHNNLGSAYINFYGDYKQGLKYCLKALELKPDYEEAAANLASAYYGLNRPDSSIHYLMLTIKLNPSNQGSFNMLSQMLIERGQLKEGLLKLEDIAKSAEDPKYLYLNIGNLYVTQLSNIPKGLDYFELAFKQDPSDTRVCQHMASLYQQIGDTKKANDVLAKCR